MVNCGQFEDYKFKHKSSPSLQCVIIIVNMAVDLISWSFVSSLYFTLYFEVYHILWPFLMVASNDHCYFYSNLLEISSYFRRFNRTLAWKSKFSINKSPMSNFSSNFFQIFIILHIFAEILAEIPLFIHFYLLNL